MNGSTNLLVPWLLEDSVVYATKINQIMRHGLPYDAYIRDHHNLSDMILDFGSLYSFSLLLRPFMAFSLPVAWQIVCTLLLIFWFWSLFGFLQKWKNQTLCPLLFYYLQVLPLFALPMSSLIFSTIWNDQSW